MQAAQRERPCLKVALTGAGGFVGGGLSALLTANGHDVVPIVRPSGREGPNDVVWDPEGGIREPSLLEGVDAVIHLAGDNIGSGRWTRAKMRSIRDSRVTGTRTLVRGLGELASPPKTFICASAIGYYGDRGDETLTETSAAGTGFLAEVCRDWEEESRRMAESGTRVVNTRFGVVLGSAGGALRTMLTPFRLGLGGPIGSGRQWFSWISIDDAVDAVYHVLTREEIAGAVNVVAAEPVRHREMVKALGRVLKRPTFAKLPGAIARLAIGRMAEETVLASTRVVPGRLLATGFRFRHPDLESALRHVLGVT